MVFQFKSSKKSNNGTDVNAGQIPQLLYRYIRNFSSVLITLVYREYSFFHMPVLFWFSRLPSNDGNTSKGKQQTSEPVHILKRSFARTVSVVCVQKHSECLWANNVKLNDF